MKKTMDSGEIMYSNAFWDVFGRLLTLFVAAFGLVLFGGTILIVFYTIFYFNNNPVGYSFALIVFLFGLVAVGATLRANIVAAAEVYLGPEEIRGKSMFGITRRIRYDEITRFHNGWLYADSKKWPRVEIGKVDEMGELFETILERAVNCRKIHLDEKEATGDLQIWQKEPNWDLINRAKRRAEENAKKAEDSEGAIRHTQ